MRKPYKKITYSDRLKIESLVKAGHTPKEIAKIITVHPSTIYRELERGSVSGVYDADLAQQSL